MLQIIFESHYFVNKVPSFDIPLTGMIHETARNLSHTQSLRFKLSHAHEMLSFMYKTRSKYLCRRALPRASWSFGFHRFPTSVSCILKFSVCPTCVCQLQISPIMPWRYRFSRDANVRDWSHYRLLELRKMGDVSFCSFIFFFVNTSGIRVILLFVWSSFETFDINSSTNASFGEYQHCTSAGNFAKISSWLNKSRSFV